MPHAMITVAVPIAKHVSIHDLRHKVAALGNLPRPDVRSAFEATGCLHFASLNVVPGSAGQPGYLVLEVSADGKENDVIAAIDAHASAHLLPVMQAALGEANPPNFTGICNDYKLRVGPGLMMTPGICYSGTPGLSLERIRKEKILEQHIRLKLAAAPNDLHALTTLSAIRDELKNNPDFAWALEKADTPHLMKDRGVAQAIAGLLFRSNLTPYLFASLIGLALYFNYKTSVSYQAFANPDANFLQFLAELWSRAVRYLMREPIGALLSFFKNFVWSAIYVLSLVAAVLGLLYWRLRGNEKADKPKDLDPDPDVISAIMTRENLVTQNHMFAVSTMKRGRLRRILLRISFWVIGQLSARLWRPGFLTDLGTIHFARWVWLPKTDKLMFCSNFDGSWESYLEDFITQAHQGLTAVWSNTVNFPRTKNLFQDGAADGDRFKRWARNQQLPTLFWYSAYEDVTTQLVRENAAIRHGLRDADTESEARAWLELFGSMPRPAKLLEMEEIQTILFGGMTSLPESACLAVQLKDEAPGAARMWLDGVRSRVSFGDRLLDTEVIVVSLSATGIARLGLRDDVIRSFPPAFVHGMDAPWRSRILGDIGDSAPDSWLWGANDARVDAMVFVFAKDAATLAAAHSREKAALDAGGHKVVKDVRTCIVTRDGQRIEAFGFVDGISQPIMRGTRRFYKGAEEINVVEPGEFVLGYPDNRGYFPPTPQVEPKFDTHNDLSVTPNELPLRWPDFAAASADCPRDLGANGSYLVVRQLEQDVPAFEKFTAAMAQELASAPGLGNTKVSSEWVGAKIVGRWKNGTSLVRYPDAPGSGLPDNDYWYGVDDPQGLRCPYGAHARRAHPRDSSAPGSVKQMSISNRHRILRVGRRYDAGPNGTTLPGLMFMCLNADIERQFEFIQQTWVQAPSFHGLNSETDPLIGTRDRSCDFTVPMPGVSRQWKNLPRFVRTLGGAYLFLPSKRALCFLSRPLA